MVSHKLYPGVEISILVDSQPLEEYSCNNDNVQHTSSEVRDHQNKSTVTKYVESVTGKKFAVRFKVDPSFKMPSTSMSFCVFVDGQFYNTLFMIEKERQRNRPWDATIQGCSVWEGNKCIGFKPMEFAEIITNDEPSEIENIARQIEKISKVGEIAVYMRRTTRAMVTKSLKPRKKRIPELDTGGEAWAIKDRLVVCEKGLKGHSKMHWVNGRSLIAVRNQEAAPMIINEKAMKRGLQISCSQCSNWIATDVDDYYFPRLIAVFKYRSDKALKSLGVKEATPQPEDEVAPSMPGAEAGISLIILDATPEPEEKLAPAILAAKAEVLTPSEADENKLYANLKPTMERMFERFMAERSDGSSTVKREASAITFAKGGAKRENQLEDDNPRLRKRVSKVKTRTVIEILDSDSEPEFIEID